MGRLELLTLVSGGKIFQSETLGVNTGTQVASSNMGL